MRIYIILLLWIITNLTGDGWLLFWAIMLDALVALGRYSYRVYKQQEASKKMEEALHGAFERLSELGKDDDQ